MTFGCFSGFLRCNFRCFNPCFRGLARGNCCCRILFLKSPVGGRLLLSVFLFLVSLVGLTLFFLFLFLFGFSNLENLYLRFGFPTLEVLISHAAFGLHLAALLPLGFLRFSCLTLGLLGMYLGFILGAIVSLVLMVTRRKTRHDAIAFGPFMILGATLCLLWGKTLLNAYAHGFFLHL